MLRLDECDPRTALLQIRKNQQFRQTSQNRRLPGPTLCRYGVGRCPVAISTTQICCAPSKRLPRRYLLRTIRHPPPRAEDSNHVRRILRVPNDKFVDVNDSQIETIRPPASPRRFQQFVDCRPPVPNDPVCDSREFLTLE